MKFEKWSEASYIFYCKLHDRYQRLSFCYTCSVWAVIKCTADKYHPENNNEPCISCDLYRDRIYLGPGKELEVKK